MTQERTAVIVRLVDRSPSITGEEILASLVPPRQFAHARFETYLPNPEFAAQAQAVEHLTELSHTWFARPGGLFHRGPHHPAVTKPGIYLDGGFGVGKTHLLAAVWHTAPEPKYYGTFMQYTALIGALGYAEVIELLRDARLLCIDEFEFDDPGDTMMMTRLLSELVASGSKIVATSNTPPNALGQGRFAAGDFLREIQAMSDSFEVIRIEGPDYRRRDLTRRAATMGVQEYERALTGLASRGAGVSSDDFDALIEHLATLHPSRYGKLLEGLQVVGLAGARVTHEQMEALRFAVFVDRLYDSAIPVIATGVPLSDVFDETMLTGGYRKKYLRASSRLVALTTGELVDQTQ
jgi:cell division protein ZapE